jgi:chorismate mutase
MNHEEARLRLDEFRVSIDDIDRRIVELINERTQVVEEIGRIKREAELPVYEPKREEQVFANITAANRGPIPPEAVRRIFERIIDEMLTIQRRKIVPPPENPQC